MPIKEGFSREENFDQRRGFPRDEGEFLDNHV
jgi:hypothetical protein